MQLPAEAMHTGLLSLHLAPLLPVCACRKPSSDGSVSLAELTLSTPHGEQTICKGLSLRLSPGQSLLIVGPSGVGKTSMMRAVAGGLSLKHCTLCSWLLVLTVGPGVCV